MAVQRHICIRTAATAGITLSWIQLHFPHMLAERWYNDRKVLRHAVGRLSNIIGPSSTSRLTYLSLHTVKHEGRKYRHPHLYRGAYGGIRHCLLTPSLQEMVEFHAWQILQHDPKYTLLSLSALLHARLGVLLSRTWLSRMLHRWRWSYKNMNHKHVRKYTAQNIAYYGQYLVNIRAIPINRIKFMDESSFSSRDLVRRRGVCARGVPLNVVSNFNLSETIKVSLLTTPFSLNPFHVDMRRGDRANDQFDFLLFLTSCVQLGLLVQGDVLVLDNARIHTGTHILQPLRLLLNTAGVTMWFLPTYSPELNPCEFIFAQSKKWLQHHRDMQHPFWYEIAKGFSQTIYSNTK